MIIITSASYISDGLISEFGKIPPVMLPFQSKRLYEHQVKLFNKEEDIFITLPQDFKLSKKDYIFFDNNNINVIFVPNGNSLGGSIIFTLNIIGRYNESVKILHGDTLFKGLPKSNNTTLVSKTSDNYNWAYSLNKKEKQVYAGYFSFENQVELIKAILLSKYKFIEGYKLYSKNNKVTEIYTDSWLDFGLPTTFHRSKATLTTERYFNDLKIGKFSVLKYSEKTEKIKAEASWFKNVPTNLKGYLPAIWNSGVEGNKSYYEIEYLSLNTLADLYVFGRHPGFVWLSIFSACNDFICSCYQFKSEETISPEESLKDIYYNKTKSRIQEYALAENFNIDKRLTINNVDTPSVNNIIDEMYFEILKNSDNCFNVIHGDFCLSNILFDFRTQSIKVIDPRGIDYKGNHTIYGDSRYDVAKLAHSILGLYDFIISGNFELKNIDKYKYELSFFINEEIIEIQDIFKNSKFLGKNIFQLSVYPIMILLFLSMLPLHLDYPQRQKAMLANALKLFVEYKNISKL